MKSTIIFLLLLHPTLRSQSVPPVMTQSGLVSGFGNDVRVFKGIPYAAAPVGELRWKPPQPPAHWDGIRTATEFGPACTQPEVGIALPKQSEDCLTLNIWTPQAKRSAKLPVMLSIHGGGFLAGWSGLPAYDGEGWARQGIVFVSVNYRLGPIGFLAHPALSRESSHTSSGNYGLLDQIQALLWIRSNIASFGGDPSRVTIFGESSGGSSVGFLLVSPLSKGLFLRAISESPQGLGLPISHRDRSWYGRAPAEQVGERLGLNIAELRGLSPEDVLKRSSPSNPNLPKGSDFQPIVDGWVLPDDPVALFESGQVHAVTLMAGTNSNDGAALNLLTRPASTVAAYREYLKVRFGEASEQAFGVYPVSDDTEVRKAEDLVATDLNFLYGARAMLIAVSKKSTNAYWFEFTHQDPLSQSMGILGAFHGAEMGYVVGDFTKSLFSGPPFVTRPLKYDESDRVLADAMNGAWVQFVKNGDPNQKGLPRWPRVSQGDSQYLEYGESIRVGRDLREKQIHFLADLLERRRRDRETEMRH